MGFRSTWVVRWVGVSLAAVLGALGPIVVMVEYQSVDSTLILWAIALFLTPFFAVPIWRYGRSRSLGWIQAVHPVLVSAGLFWQSPTDTVPWLWPLLVLVGDLSFITLAWLTLADDDGHVRGFASRFALWVNVVFSIAWGLVDTVVYPAVYLDTRTVTYPPSSYAFWPNSTLYVDILPPINAAGGWVLSVVVWIPLLIAAIRQRGATRWIRWTVFAGFVLTSAYEAAIEYSSTGIFSQGGPVDIAQGVVSLGLIPILVTVGLVLSDRDRRADAALEKDSRPAAVR